MKHRLLAHTDILELVKTKEDADVFQKQIEEVSAGLFKPGASGVDLIDKFISFDKREKMLDMFLKHDIEISDIAALAQFFTDTIEALREIPVIKITLAFSPARDFVLAISETLVREYKMPCLLDISVDLKIIGGAILELSGIYKDYSLRSVMLEKYKNGVFKINRDYDP